MKKTIGIFTTSYLPEIGGIQYELQWLLESFGNFVTTNDYCNLEIVFLVPNRKALNYCNFENIKVINTGIDNASKFNMLKQIFVLNNIIKKNNIDVIHTYSASEDSKAVFLIKKLFRKKVKYIVTSQGADIAYDTEVNYGARCSWWRSYLIKLILKEVEIHTTISEEMLKLAIDAGSSKDKVRLIPNGLKSVDKNVNEYIKHSIIEKYNIKDEDVCYLSLSGHRPIKGLTYLVDAFSETSKRYGNLKLFLAAHGSETDKIRSLIKQKGADDNIYLVGFVAGEEKKALFNICDVYCNVAIFEPFGIALLEAMDYGLAIIGSIKGGIKDYIHHNKNGLLVEPKDVYSIYSALIKMRDKDFRNKLISESARDVKNYYIDNIAKQYLNLYESI